MDEDGFADVADVTEDGYDFAPDPSSVGMDSSDNSEEYNSAIENQTQKQAYTSMRGATATNPYPESFFSRMFGAENVNYTNILGGGQAGLNRVAEINDLRFRQAIGLPSLKTGKQYQAGDYYIGQDTNMGTVKAIPDMARDIMSFIPGGGIMSNFIPQKGLPENDPRYQAIMEEREKSANDPTVFDRTSDFVKSILGLGPKDSGASLAASPVGEGQMRVPDTRTFDTFGNVTGSNLDTKDNFGFNRSIPKGYITVVNPVTGLEELRYDRPDPTSGIGAINKEVTNNAVNNIVSDNMIGNPKYSINMRLNAGESLSDIVKSRTQ